MAAAGGHWVKGSFQPAGGRSVRDTDDEYGWEDEDSLEPGLGYWDPEEMYGYEGPDPYDVAKEAGIYISSDKEPKFVWADENGEVVGASFIAVNDDEYSADIAVIPGRQGSGAGGKLLEATISDFREEQDYREGLVFKADVVNPRMAEMMARRGFTKVRDTGENRVEMELR